MRTTPSASERLEAVRMLSENYRMVDDAVVNFTSVNEAAEIADEYGLKLCLIDKGKRKIRVDKYHVADLSQQYDLSAYMVAVSD